MHISNDLVDVTKPVNVAADNSENSVWQNSRLHLAWARCARLDLAATHNLQCACLKCSIGFVGRTAPTRRTTVEQNYSTKKKKNNGRVVLRGIRIAVQWSCKFRRRRRQKSSRRRRKYVQLTPRNASCKATQRKYSAQIPEKKEARKKSHLNVDSATTCSSSCKWCQ